MKILHVFTLISTPRAFFDNQFKYLSENGQDIWLVTNSEEDTEFSTRNHLTYRKINIERRISPFADIKSIWELFKLIKKEKFDIVVGHTPKGALVSMIAAKLSFVKSRLYYRHGLIYTTANGMKRYILKFVERLTSYFSTSIINVSPSLSRLAIKDHLNLDKKQLVIGAGTCGGIDTKNIFNPKNISGNDLSNIKNNLEITDNDFIIGFCGRICKEKGIRELIDGFLLFKKDHPNISTKLLLVGSYDSRDLLPEHYKKLIADNSDILSIGYVDKKKLPIYYALMNVFVFPSYREGFGMCIIEAGAMEVPALVSRSHGCIDSIEEGVTGYYIDIEAKNIAQNLAKIYNDKNIKSIGQNARKSICQKYDYSIMWPLIKEIYETL